MKNNLIVYENRWIIEEIYSVTDRIRNKVTDTTLFEERVINRISEYLHKKEANKKNSRYIIRMINEVARSVVNRNKNEHAQTFSELTTVDCDGESIEFEPIDVLANVESDVIAKEMAALLAQDDRRKTVVEAWTDGNTNTKSISRTLARTFGGNVESHRKFVQRFRNECHALLDVAI